MQLARNVMDRVQQTVCLAPYLSIIKQLQKLVFLAVTPISMQMTHLLLARTVIQLAQRVVQALQTV